MASRMARTRACQECRYRRVKCDETALCCKQCMRLGLQCSGPVKGILILDMTDSVRPGKRLRSRRLRAAKRSPVSQMSLSDNTNSPHSSLSQMIISDNTSSSDLDQCERPYVSSNFDELELAKVSPKKTGPGTHLSLELSEMYRSCNANAFEQLFISQFVDLVSTIRTLNPDRPKSWLFQLPAFLSLSTLPVLKYSIRAVAMAYYAFRHADKSIQADSYRWYIAGLESQRAVLQNHTCERQVGLSSDNSKLPDLEEICAPLMFTYFEIIQNTTPAGWSQHLAAAGKMFKMRGPANCQTGVVHQMFSSLRLFTAYISILAIERSGFESTDWCTIPFATCQKLPFDYIIDILLSIPHYLILSGTKGTLESLADITGGNREVISGVSKPAIELLRKLNDWWWYFERQNFTGSESSAFQDANPVIDVLSPLEHQYSPIAFVYRDLLTACTVALYNVANIIAHSILYRSSSSPTELSCHGQEIESQCASIMSVAAFVELHPLAHGEYIRVIFPLKIVALLSTSIHQRILAQETAKRWVAEIGLSGTLGISEDV